MYSYIEQKLHQALAITAREHLDLSKIYSLSLLVVLVFLCHHPTQGGPTGK